MTSILVIPWVVRRVLSGIAVNVRSVLIGLLFSAAFVTIWMLFSSHLDVLWSVWLALALSPFWILIATERRYYHEFCGWFTTENGAILARAEELGLEGVGCQFSQPFVGVGFKLAQPVYWEAAEGAEDTMGHDPDWHWTDEVPEGATMMKLSREFPESPIVYIEATEWLGRFGSQRFGGYVFADGHMEDEWGKEALPRLLRHLGCEPLPESPFPPASVGYEWCDEAG
jgi:hypothetical protein